MTDKPNFRIKIKVPQTLEEAAKLRNGLEREMHRTPLPARNFQSNIIHAIKATTDLADLLRPAKQTHLAWQIEQYTGAVAAAEAGIGRQ